jgi:tetratricopeptide (TPR) repeat protein
VGNDLGGSVTGPVVQAGSVGQIHYHLHGGQVSVVPSVPSQLPRGPRFFTNRARELAELASCQADPDDQAPLVVISGAAGVGKTTLVLRWLRTVRESFRDGQLYVDLGGFSVGEPVDPVEVLEWFLAALGVAADRVPDGLAARAALFRTVTDGLAVAVLLDNAASAAQVRPLVPSGLASVVVVTSRWRLTGLAVDGARFVVVDPLDRTDSADLLRRFLHPSRSDGEADAVRRLADLCGGLPIALSMVGARLSTHPRRSVAREADDLAAGQRRLGARSVGDEQSITAVFDLSYDSLPENARQLYRAAALHPGPQFGVPVLTEALPEGPGDVEGVLDLLVEANLLMDVSDHRFGFHDLVRLHARQQADRVDSTTDRDAVVRRMVEWYLDTAVAADLLVHPLRERLGPRYAVRPERADLFRRDTEALAWLETERENVISAALDAHSHGWYDLVWQICEALWGAFLHGRRYDGWITLHRSGVDAAHRCGDQRAEARLLAQLGFAYAKLGRYDDAIEQNTRGLALADEVGDDRARATALSQLGRAARGKGDLDTAVDYYRAARDLQAELGVRRGVALCSRRIGDVLMMQGRPREAVPEFRQAESVMAELGDTTQRARSLMFLGRALAASDQVDVAAEALGTALELMRALGSTYYQAEILAVLGEVAERTGDLAAARAHLTEALAHYRTVEDPGEERVQARLDALDDR